MINITNGVTLVIVNMFSAFPENNTPFILIRQNATIIIISIINIIKIWLWWPLMLLLFRSTPVSELFDTMDKTYCPIPETIAEIANMHATKYIKTSSKEIFLLNIFENIE